MGGKPPFAKAAIVTRRADYVRLELESDPMAFFSSLGDGSGPGDVFTTYPEIYRSWSQMSQALMCPVEFGRDRFRRPKAGDHCLCKPPEVGRSRAPFQTAARRSHYVEAWNGPAVEVLGA